MRLKMILSAVGVVSISSILGGAIAVQNYTDDRYMKKSDHALYVAQVEVKEYQDIQELEQIRATVDTNRDSHTRDNCLLWASDTLEKIAHYDELIELGDTLSPSEERDLDYLVEQLDEYRECASSALKRIEGVE